MRETIAFEKRFKTVFIMTFVLTCAAAALVPTQIISDMVADYLNADF